MILSGSVLLSGSVIGCGNNVASGNTVLQPPAPSNLSYPQETLAAIVGTAIAPDTPTVTGTVTGYSVNLALPAGLSLDSSVGTISGTPTAAMAQGNYTVTASNATGSTSVTLQISVAIPAPSNLTYPQTVINATVGTAIAPDTPTVTGAVAGYSVNPALPAGLSLDSSAGTISGTPTAAMARANYTVTASNATGSTSVTLQISVVIPAPSNLRYPQTAINATIGTAIASDTPTVTGTVAQFSVVPSLPAGLSLDPSTGTVSGTPTAAAARTSYTVTATNSVGNTSAQLTIEVNSAGTVLLEQGHGSSILTLRATSDRLLSEDSGGHWVLWDYSSGGLLAQGDGAGTADTKQIDLAGQLAVVATSQEVQVYSAQDGHLVFTVPTPSWWRLAQDGSYICSGTASSLTVWSASGQTEFALNGDYHSAVAFAAPSQIQVAAGPAGTTVIETDTVPGGASSVGPAFSGNFYAWFLDGHRFLTTLGNAVWVYSNAAVQQGLVTLPNNNNLTGQGAWLWIVTSNATLTDQLQIYPIGSSTPAQTFTLDLLSQYFASGTTIGVLPYGLTQLSVIDLSGSSPSRSDFSIPSVAYLSSFATNSTSQWVVGNQHGVLVDGASLSTALRYFGYGAVNSIVGTPNQAVVSTAIGKILLYDVSVPKQSGSIDFLAEKLALSSDGTVLGAAAPSYDDQYVPDRTLNLYSLPSMSTINSFPYTFNEAGIPILFDFSLSGSGNTVGQVQVTLGSGQYSREVTGVAGSPTTWTDTGSNTPIQLSPDGTLIAVASVIPCTCGSASNLTTNIYKGGTLTTAITGYGEGWIDNGRLLVGDYVDVEPGAGIEFTGSTIYDPTGAVLTNIPNTLPPLSSPQFPTPDSVYDANTNAIYSLTTGQVIWQGPIPQVGSSGLGAVAGSMVVYETGHQVILYSVN